MDRRDAEIVGLFGAVQLNRPAIPDELARRSGKSAGEYFDQRRLAGAVGAEQAVNLARRDVEIDAAQGDRTAAEGLADIAHLQKRRVVSHRSRLDFDARESAAGITIPGRNRRDWPW